MASASDRPGPSDPAVVGRVVRPHGLAGEVVVDPADSGSLQFEPGTHWWLAGRWCEVVRSRVHSGRWVVRLGGIADRDAAEALRAEEIAVEAAELPELESGRYYIHDLVGCRVEDPEGADLGEIVAVVSGPQDWLEIEQEGERTLVPMVQALVKEVDVEAGRVVIDPPPGLAEVTKA